MQLFPELTPYKDVGRITTTRHQSITDNAPGPAPPENVVPRPELLARYFF